VQAFQPQVNSDQLWQQIKSEATADAKMQPLLADFLYQQILQHPNFSASLAYILASKLASNPQGVVDWQQSLLLIMEQQPAFAHAALQDMRCQLQDNAAVKGSYTVLLYFSGFQALQMHRFAHYYWIRDNTAMANYIQSRALAAFGVDIHPGAQIGQAVFMDHAVGIVIGETAEIEDNVTLFQSVTLGGRGKGSGDRHPKVRRGAFIGAGAVVLGNIEIGVGAKVGAGALVVKSVGPGLSVIGHAANLLDNK